MGDLSHAATAVDVAVLISATCSALWTRPARAGASYCDKYNSLQCLEHLINSARTKHRTGGKRLRWKRSCAAAADPDFLSLFSQRISVTRAPGAPFPRRPRWGNHPNVRAVGCDRSVDDWRAQRARERERDSVSHLHAHCGAKGCLVEVIGRLNSARWKVRLQIRGEFH